MVFEAVKVDGIFSALNFTSGAINTNAKLNVKPTSGRDTFKSYSTKLNPAQQNPIYLINDAYLAKVAPSLLVGKYSSTPFLKEVLQTNPAAMSLAQEGKVYPQNVTSEIQHHFIPTNTAAFKIMEKCGENFTKDDYENMRKATLLHDIGKAYIPAEILNKKGKLTEEERQIVNRHAQLSYETLKSGGVKGPVLELVKNHHTYSSKNTPLVQILQIADIWSALKEKRSYKEAFSDEQALKILYERAENGDFEKKYIDALAA